MRGIVGWVFARGGSKGVRRKNLRTVGGVPLIGHAVNSLRGSRSVETVFVSTDDTEIADVANSFGAKVPFLRPEHLASDTASEWDSWKHALRWMKSNDYKGAAPKAMVSAPCTSPLRAPSDIDGCVELLLKTSADAVVTGTPAQRSPYFNMVRLDPDGFLKIAIRDEQITRRQDAPSLYDLTTVAYACKVDHVSSASGLYAGKVALKLVPQERAIDIDTEWDLNLANLIWSDQKIEKS